MFFSLSTVQSVACAATCTSVAVYDFNKYSSFGTCANANPPCTSAVDVVYFVDQKNPSLSGFSLYDQNFLVAGVSNTVAFTNPGARFGVAFSGGSGRTSAVYVPTALSNSVTALVQGYFTSPSIGGSLDFAGMIQSTLVQYWCAGSIGNCAAPSANSNPRRLVVVVHGADVAGTTTWASVWSLYSLLRVEVHVEAVGNGTLTANAPLLSNIVNGNTTQITTWPYEIMLPSDNAFLYRRVCPLSSSLCDCGGFCSCSAPGSYNCTCPSSCQQFDACNPASCTTPSRGCELDLSKKVYCSPANVCFTSVCVDSNGVNVAGGTASCSSTPVNCTTTNLCLTAYCDTTLGCKTQTSSSLPAVCNSNNPCIIDGCNATGQGSCTHTAVPYSVQNPQVCVFLCCCCVFLFFSSFKVWNKPLFVDWQ
jgi:hypothetical protein